MNLYIADAIACKDDSTLHRHRIAWALEWMMSMPADVTPGVVYRKETAEAIYLLRAMLSEKKTFCKFAYQQITNPIFQSDEQASAPKPDQGGISYEHALGNANFGAPA